MEPPSLFVGRTRPSFAPTDGATALLNLRAQIDGSERQLPSVVSRRLWRVSWDGRCKQDGGGRVWAAPRRLWPRRARGPPPVGFADHAADFWLGAGHDSSAGHEPSTARRKFVG